MNADKLLCTGGASSGIKGSGDVEGGGNGSRRQPRSTGIGEGKPMVALRWLEKSMAGGKQR